jgi:hypothetical protein
MFMNKFLVLGTERMSKSTYTTFHHVLKLRTFSQKKQARNENWITNAATNTWISCIKQSPFNVPLFTSRAHNDDTAAFRITTVQLRPLCLVYFLFCHLQKRSLYSLSLIPSGRLILRFTHSFIQSFRSLSYNRPLLSSKASSPQSAI